MDNAKKIVVLGGGESGVGAALLAHKKGFNVFLSDGGNLKDNYREQLQSASIAFEEGGHTAEKVLAADEIIKSPGIPQTAPLVQQARQQGIVISSEIDFAARYTSGKILAITGTNGKTTTTLLLHHLLAEAGYDVAVGGNIGNSFAQLLLVRDYEYFVLEISSFQLEGIYKFKPNVALILNITPDHLDRYEGSMDLYADAKFRLIENMNGGGLFIYNADDETIARAMNKRQITTATEPFSSSFHHHEALHLQPMRFSMADVEAEQQPLVFDQLPLKGPHNAMNQMAAILAALRVGVTPDQVKQALAIFKNAAHRLEEVAVVNNISFINDSKGTNIDATQYALDSFGDRKIVWIAGGVDKGNDYSLLDKLVAKNVKALICLGKDNNKLVKHFTERISFIHETTSVKEAVMKAYHLADPNDVVLLSPACASFDLFKNYEDRGRQFTEAVKEQLLQLDMSGTESKKNG